MQVTRLGAVGAVAAAVIYLAANQPVEVIFISSRAAASSFMSTPAMARDDHREHRMFLVEQRVAALEEKLARSQRELARARVALIIARSEMMDNEFLEREFGE